MAIYRGKRVTPTGVLVTVDGETLPSRIDVRDHSPDGFGWGYGGSGPAQLALAVLTYHLGDEEEALEHYQAFKWEVVADLPLEEWELTTEEINDWLRTMVEGFEATVASPTAALKWFKV